MKSAGKIIFILGVCGSLMFYSGCSKKNPAAPSITDQQLAILTKGTSVTWKVSAVTKDNIDEKNPDYASFAMTLTGAIGSTDVGYSTAGRTGTKYPWAAQNGKLTFDTTNPATTLLRDDGVVVTYAVTASQLIMSFNYSGPGFNARTSVVTGIWQFTFIP